MGAHFNYYFISIPSRLPKTKYVLSEETKDLIAKIKG